MRREGGEGVHTRIHIKGIVQLAVRGRDLEESRDLSVPTQIHNRCSAIRWQVYNRIQHTSGDIKRRRSPQAHGRVCIQPQGMHAAVYMDTQTHARARRTHLIREDDDVSVRHGYPR